MLSSRWAVRDYTFIILCYRDRDREWRCVPNKGPAAQDTDRKTWKHEKILELTDDTKMKTSSARIFLFCFSVSPWKVFCKLVNLSLLSSSSFHRLFFLVEKDKVEREKMRKKRRFQMLHPKRHHQKPLLRPSTSSSPCLLFGDEDVVDSLVFVCLFSNRWIFIHFLLKERR